MKLKERQPTRKTNIKMDTAEGRKDGRTREKMRKWKRRGKTEIYCDIQLLKNAERARDSRKTKTKKMKLLMFLKVMFAPT